MHLADKPRDTRRNILIGGATQRSTEQVQQFDPEVIVAAWCGFCGKEDLGVIRNREGWQGITAIKTGRVHSLDDNYLNSPDPRLGEGAKRLAALFHPDIF